MLTETEFLDNYRLAQTLRHQGDVANAREILFLLFDRGRHVGGCGAVRLTFVLGDLAELAGVGRRRPDEAALDTLQRLRVHRDEREEAARSGEAAFVELQELVALNRVLGQPERSADLVRRLQHELADAAGDGGEERQRTVSTLADLVRHEIAPDDPEELVQEIWHHRLRGRLAQLTRTVHELLDADRTAASRRASVEDSAGAAGLARRLEELAGDCRRLAVRVHDPEAGSVGRVRRELRGRVRDEVAELARETWLLLGEPLRLSPLDASADDAALRQRAERLRDLARRARTLSARHGLDETGDRGEELERRVLEMAADVATAIAEQRVWEDFRQPDDADRDELEAWLDKKVRHDGLLVYAVLLRLEDERAERMADWLLAYRPDAEMYRALLDTTRRTGHAEMERRLGEEASRLAVG